MEEFFNLKIEEERLLLLQKKEFLKLRRELLKITSKAPKEIEYLCIAYHSNNKLLKNLKLEIELDINKECQNYLKYCEIASLRLLVELGFNYELLIDAIFDVDNIYKKGARKLVEHTGYDFLGILYKIINYIDDNFPIKKNREFNNEESKLIDFLLFEGSAEKYAKTYNIKQEIVNSQIEDICNNYNSNSNNLNTVINLILIERYKKEYNNDLLKVIDC